MGQLENMLLSIDERQAIVGCLYDANVASVKPTLMNDE